MKAAYMLASIEDIDRLKALDEDALIEALDAQERARPEAVAYIDQTWDAIHWLLCDNTTARPIEGNGLSEAIVGAHWFDDEDPDAAFIAYCTVTDCARIHQAIGKIRADELPLGLDYAALARLGAFGAEWFAQEPEWACETLMHDFADLQRLYARAAVQQTGMVVSFL